MAEDPEETKARRETQEKARAERELRLQQIHAAQARRTRILSRADNARRRLPAGERDRGKGK